MSFVFASLEMYVGDVFPLLTRDTDSLMSMVKDHLIDEADMSRPRGVMKIATTCLALIYIV